MRTKVITAPAAEPLTASAVKIELGIDSSEKDAYINRLISSARSFFEEETGYALINRTLEGYLRFWPKATNIFLPYPPLVSVTHVKYYPLGVITTLSSAGYIVDITSRQSSVVLIPGTAWPTSVLYPPGIVVTYVAGFGATAASVPFDILQCLAEIIAFWDEVPEAAYVPGTNKTAGKVEVLPFGAKDIITRYKKQREQ